MWVAKSAAEWCVETDLTHEQYKDAVATLRQLGLIVTAQHRFAGKTITHLRLTEPGGALVGWWSLEALQVGGGGAWRHRPSYRNYPTGTTPVQDSVLPHAGGPGGKKQTLGKQEDEGSEMKAKDALAKFHKQDKSAKLELLWKSLLAEVTGKFAHNLTKKQKGQLTLIADKCPEGTAPQVLEHTLRHWVPFTSAAEDEAGAYKAPLKPDVGFLLRYVGVAINLWIEDTQKKPKAASKPPVQSTAPPPPPPEPAPPNESMTLDQMYDLLLEDY